jgi:hypothetical protein
VSLLEKQTKEKKPSIFPSMDSPDLWVHFYETSSKGIQNKPV